MHSTDCNDYHHLSLLCTQYTSARPERYAPYTPVRDAEFVDPFCWLVKLVPDRLMKSRHDPIDKLNDLEPSCIDEIIKHRHVLFIQHGLLRREYMRVKMGTQPRRSTLDLHLSLWQVCTDELTNISLSTLTYASQRGIYTWKNHYENTRAMVLLVDQIKA